MSTAIPYKTRIEGMDCAACALKIERALERIPGVANIHVSFTAGALTLEYDEDRVSPSIIEKKVSAFGYRPVILHADEKSGVPTKLNCQFWWKGAKAARSGHRRTIRRD